MSDFSSMSRESKKDKLRRQIVSPQQPAWNAEPEEDSEAVVRRAHNRVLRHRWILVLLVLLLIAAGAAAWFFYQRNYRYSGYETAWQVDLNEGSLVGYERSHPEGSHQQCNRSEEDGFLFLQQHLHDAAIAILHGTDQSTDRRFLLLLRAVEAVTKRNDGHCTDEGCHHTEDDRKA